MTMSYDDAGTRGVQRFEVFTGAGKRREWPPEVKASIVAESYSGLETVCAVARRHGLSPSQLFAWRRQVRRELEGKGMFPSAKLETCLPSEAAEAPAFVPAVIERAVAAAPAPPRRSRRRRSSQAAVELEIDGIAVKIAHGADAGVIAAVLEALRATR
jgi:transposase